jgi:hypothetical protein
MPTLLLTLSVLAVKLPSVIAEFELIQWLFAAQKVPVKADPWPAFWMQ